LDACITYTCPIGRVYYYTRPIGRVYYYTRPTGHVYIIHAPNWTRVCHTRVQFWHVYSIHVSKCYCVTIWHVSYRHVSILTRVYSNRYCRHASKCCNFCSVCRLCQLTRRSWRMTVHHFLFLGRHRRFLSKKDLKLVIVCVCKPQKSRGIAC
jgi:hypothetical protein